MRERVRTAAGLTWNCNNRAAPEVTSMRRLGAMSLVRTDIHAGVATVTLADPERRNALTLPMVTEIIDTFDELEADPAVGAVVVTGDGPGLLRRRRPVAPLVVGRRRRRGRAARDLRGVPAHRALAAAHPRRRQRRRRRAPGMNLALVCDVRLAAHRARFDTRFLQLGLHPGGGHTWMAQRIAGPQAVLATVLFGEVLDGAEAERVGLVWRCVPDDELLARRAGRWPSAPPAARTSWCGGSRPPSPTSPPIDDHAAAVDRELEPQVWSLEQPAFKERVAALQAKITKK